MHEGPCVHVEPLQWLQNNNMKSNFYSNVMVIYATCISFQLHKISCVENKRIGVICNFFNCTDQQVEPSCFADCGVIEYSQSEPYPWITFGAKKTIF